MFLSVIKVSSIPLNWVLHLDSAASYPLIQNTCVEMQLEGSIGFIRIIKRLNPKSHNSRTVSGYGRSGLDENKNSVYRFTPEFSWLRA
jgi:hypothetical protein